MKTEIESDTILRVNSGSKYEVLANYSRALRVENWVFVSNTSGFDYAANSLADSALEQAEQMFTNIETALKTAGASMKDIVMARLFAPNGEDLEAITGLIGEKFAPARPAMTATCSPLAAPPLKVEMEVTAYIRG